MFISAFVLASCYQLVTRERAEGTLTHITIEYTSRTIELGYTAYLSANVVSDGDATIRWTSSGGVVLRIDGDNRVRVRGISAGTATVTASPITSPSPTYSVFATLTMTIVDSNAYRPFFPPVAPPADCINCKDVGCDICQPIIIIPPPPPPPPPPINVVVPYTFSVCNNFTLTFDGRQNLIYSVHMFCRLNNFLTGIGVINGGQPFDISSWLHSGLNAIRVVSNVWACNSDAANQFINVGYFEVYVKVQDFETEFVFDRDGMFILWDRLGGTRTNVYINRPTDASGVFNLFASDNNPHTSERSVISLSWFQFTGGYYTLRFETNRFLRYENGSIILGSNINYWQFYVLFDYHIVDYTFTVSGTSFTFNTPNVNPAVTYVVYVDAGLGFRRAGTISGLSSRQLSTLGLTTGQNTVKVLGGVVWSYKQGIIQQGREAAFWEIYYIEEVYDTGYVFSVSSSTFRFNGNSALTYRVYVKRAGTVGLS